MLFSVRKWLTMLLLIAVFAATAGLSGIAQAAQGISIYLNGERLESDVPPYILPQVNVTMVPLRVISEGLGAEVSWVQTVQTATIKQADTVIAMTVDQKYAWVNGTSIPLDASVQNRQGRVMVPLRFVSEQLGLQVNWDQATRTINLLSGEAPPPPDVAVPAPVPSQPPAPQPPTSRPADQAELRGVWISTVYNLDWPTTRSYGNPAQQQQEYVQLLDELQAMGMNTVFVQVRPTADAFYPSQMVPWSKFLSGTQGKDPGYDPLVFMIEETHRRGMQFHAWFNPFRANPDAKTDQLAPNHVAKLHPEWIVNGNNKLYINPGIPQARQQIIAEIMEVVNRYDIDGVHLDDYFYPSDGVFPDDATFRIYNSKGFANKDEWRRDNINQFVKELGQAIDRVKPEIMFGISPFGVWRNKAVDPTGSDTQAGVMTYDDMHADVRTWIQHEWIDYIMPQIYWSLSFSRARYDILVNWWANEVKGTRVKLYIGHAPYKLGTKEAGWHSAQEIIHQVEYNKQVPAVEGDVFFSAKDLRRNPLGIADLLTRYYGQTP